MTQDPENVFPAKYKADVDLEELEETLYTAFRKQVSEAWAAQAAVEIVDLGYVPIQWRHTFGDDRSDKLNGFLKTIKDEKC